MKIKVKDWWYKKEQSKAQSYDWTLCWEKVYAVKEGVSVIGTDDNGIFFNEAWGKSCFDMGKADHVGYALFGEVVKETDKAIAYRLKFWNLRKAHRYITDAPIEDRWLTWIPKSVLL